MKEKEQDYTERKKELEIDFQLLKDKTLQKFFQTVNEYNQDSGRIGKKYQELTAKEENKDKKDEKLETPNK